MWLSSISNSIKVPKLLAAISVLTLLLSMPRSAIAATFSVNPVIVVLAKGGSSTTVEITNQNPQKLRLQITGFAWNQSTSGEMQLTPTDDLVFFPQLVTLDPGETRRIRIGITAGQGTVEKAFRVFMEELPSLESVVAPKTNGVTVRMKVGIPVFVAPVEAPVVSGSVREATLNDNALGFDVVNTGNTHFSIQKVSLVGKNASGGDVLSRDLTGWYVLAGGTRHYSVPLPKGACSELRSLSVRVETNAVTFSNSFSDIANQCGSPGHSSL